MRAGHPAHRPLPQVLGQRGVRALRKWLHPLQKRVGLSCLHLQPDRPELPHLQLYCQRVLAVPGGRSAAGQCVHSADLRSGHQLRVLREPIMQRMQEGVYAVGLPLQRKLILYFCLY